MHHSLYRTSAKEKVVLHTHPNELIALTHLPDTNQEEALNYALWSMIPEAKIYVPRGIGLVPYRLTASQSLADATVKALERKHKVVMWEKHGALAVGKDPLEAFDLIDAMNKSATLYLLCKNTGQNPQGLTREQIDEIGHTFPVKE
jgi:rhamnulose-1-phosphate aldolase